MSKKYIETSFTSFVKHKLNETIKNTRIENKKSSEEIEATDNKPAEEDKLIKDKKEIGRDSYMYELQREFNKIWQEYDNLYGE